MPDFADARNSCVQEHATRRLLSTQEYSLHTADSNRKEQRYAGINKHSARIDLVSAVVAPCDHFVPMSILSLEDFMMVGHDQTAPIDLTGSDDDGGFLDDPSDRQLRQAMQNSMEGVHVSSRKRASDNDILNRDTKIPRYSEVKLEKMEENNTANSTERNVLSPVKTSPSKTSRTDRVNIAMSAPSLVGGMSHVKDIIKGSCTSAKDISLRSQGLNSAGASKKAEEAAVSVAENEGQSDNIRNAVSWVRQIFDAHSCVYNNFGSKPGKQDPKSLFPATKSRQIVEKDVPTHETEGLNTKKSVAEIAKDPRKAVAKQKVLIPEVGGKAKALNKPDDGVEEASSLLELSSFRESVDLDDTMSQKAGATEKKKQNVDVETSGKSFTDVNIAAVVAASPASPKTSQLSPGRSLGEHKQAKHTKSAHLVVNAGSKIPIAANGTPIDREKECVLGETLGSKLQGRSSNVAVVSPSERRFHIGAPFRAMGRSNLAEASAINPKQSGDRRDKTEVCKDKTSIFLGLSAKQSTTFQGFSRAPAPNTQAAVLESTAGRGLTDSCSTKESSSDTGLMVTKQLGGTGADSAVVMDTTAFLDGLSMKRGLKRGDGPTNFAKAKEEEANPGKTPDRNDAELFGHPDGLLRVGPDTKQVSTTKEDVKAAAKAAKVPRKEMKTRIKKVRELRNKRRQEVKAQRAARQEAKETTKCPREVVPLFPVHNPVQQDGDTSSRMAASFQHTINVNCNAPALPMMKTTLEPKANKIKLKLPACNSFPGVEAQNLSFASANTSFVSGGKDHCSEVDKLTLRTSHDCAFTPHGVEGKLESRVATTEDCVDLSDGGHLQAPAKVGSDEIASIKMRHYEDKWPRMSAQRKNHALQVEAASGSLITTATADDLALVHYTRKSPSCFSVARFAKVIFILAVAGIGCLFVHKQLRIEAMTRTESREIIRKNKLE